METSALGRHSRVQLEPAESLENWQLGGWDLITDMAWTTPASLSWLDSSVLSSH